MAGEFFPRREGELRFWSAHLAAKLVAAPQDYGIAPERAAHYADLHQQYAEAFTRAADPGTRTRVAVEAKRDAKAKLIEELRVINGIVKSRREVSAARRINLGVNPRNRGGRATRIARPDTAPIVLVESVTGRTARVRLSDSQSGTRRGRPRGTKSACVYRYVGPTPPSGTDGWQFITQAIRTRLAITMPAHVPAGARVWLTCAWTNPRGEIGPAATPVSFNVSDGVVLQVARVRRAA